MNKKDILETKLGNRSRKDYNFWKKHFKSYICGNDTSKSLANHIGLDSRTILNIFKEYGWVKSEKTHLKTKMGYLSKDNISDWEKYYNMYLGGKSLEEVADILGTERKTLTYYFKRFGFELRTMSDSVKLATNKTIKTNRLKYGTDYPKQSNTRIRNIINFSIPKFKDDYLNESRLGIFLNERIGGEWIHNRKVPDSGIDNRPDYRNEKHKLIVEFDGNRHYMSYEVMLKDKKKDTVYKSMGYSIIRIPYYIQLDEYVIKLLFSKYTNNFKAFNDYPHGFIDTSCYLPVDFNALGTVKYTEDLEKFSDISEFIKLTADKKVLDMENLYV